MTHLEQSRAQEIIRVSDYSIVQTVASTRLDHGGTSRSVPALAQSLGRIGVDWYLVSTCPAGHETPSGLPKDGERWFLAPEKPNRMRLDGAKAMKRQLKTLLAQPSAKRWLVHDHGVWLPSNHFVADLCQRRSVPRIVSPRGMLSPWSMNFSAWKKKIAWPLFQRRDLTSAAGFHATCEAEADDIARLGFKQPVCVAPNGLSIKEETLQTLRNSTLSRGAPDPQNPGAAKTALFLSRIHPKKGLLQWIDVWKQVQPSGWKMRIIGPDEAGHAAEVEATIRKAGLEDEIEISGERNDTEKWQEYVAADLFVLPTFSENFGIVIAEAMASGLPVLTTTGAPWKCLQEHRMGWWVDPTPEMLTSAFRNAISKSPAELSEMGRRGSQYAMTHFSWKETARKLSDFYLSILNQ
ncbi:Glycosyltransferase [Rhodopirellula islandica]|uniref:Glycosyltransferase n=1 Tax=Rhodopirellula islandica TaxID=595434 RepID=A0A0J1EBI9_RHOIS|nr:glycosyltransferase [Rhodopirellula islandica]KLU02924.1 Glycosyltransferase [Rhodopirellula islandica]